LAAVSPGQHGFTLFQEPTQRLLDAAAGAHFK
jgi:hypothetical protein